MGPVLQVLSIPPIGIRRVYGLGGNSSSKCRHGQASGDPSSMCRQDHGSGGHRCSGGWLEACGGCSWVSGASVHGDEAWDAPLGL